MYFDGVQSEMWMSSMKYKFETSEDFAHKLDSEDPLARFRQRFYIPEGAIYMDGNSLGLLSKDSESSVFRVLNEWKTFGIKGWLEAKHPWFYLAEKARCNVCETCRCET